MENAGDAALVDDAALQPLDPIYQLIPNLESILRGAPTGGAWENVDPIAQQDWQLIEEALMQQAERESWNLLENTSFAENAESRTAAEAAGV